MANTMLTKLLSAVSDNLPWREKLNPAQELIAREEGSQVGTETSSVGKNAFDHIEVVNRGVGMIVNGCCAFDFDIKDKVMEGVQVGMKAKTLAKLLNFRPNPYQSVQSFRMALFTDFILEGNAFVYYDGAFLYHLPADRMVVESDPKTYISGYTYNGITKFGPDEIFVFSDLNNTSIYRGKSRLSAANRSIATLYCMQKFQDSFFENGAIPGLVLETDNTLSQAAKQRTISSWISSYNPKAGARKPMIVDNGLKLKTMFEIDFQELDFDTSIKTHTNKILTALGVPSILLEGGNNANISPNLRLLYLETVLPIVNRFTSEVERFFGYDISPVTNNITALQPDLREISAYHAALVNGGIETPDEAREALRLELITGQGTDKIRVPANIAGSASNPNEGGAPKKTPTADNGD